MQIPIEKNRPYMAWTGDTGPLEAEASFLAKYGQRPLHVGLDQWGRNLLAGPIPENKEEILLT